MVGMPKRQTAKAAPTAKPAKVKYAVPIVSLRHKDKRANIPTEELRGFVKEEEAQTSDVTLPGLLYARDPSLDPQLVWKGKDEQDRKPLTVPSVPIYIQEKIHPQALIEDLRAESKKDVPQLNLFADFNGIKFEELIEFYQHESNWANRMILGDSLLAMTSLAEREGLKGKVQMIYIDPPYGIKFGSNWQVSTRKRDVKDSKVEDATRQPEQIRAFRDTWELGIHSYLAYWRDRLVTSRDLLTETGSIFVQIGAENVHLVRCVLDEVFGAENFISLITFATTSGFEANELPRAGDYLLWFAKNKASGVKFRPLFELNVREVGEGLYRFIRYEDGFMRSLTASEVEEGKIPPNSKIYSPDNMLSQGAASEVQTFEFQGRKFDPGTNSHWKPNFPDGLLRLGKADRLHSAKNSIRFVRLASDFPMRSRNNLWTDTLTGQFTDEKIYVVQTNIKIIERCLLMTTDPGDLVLDPTCGSGTTAYVAELWGRRWITCDTSRVALTLARTRLMAAKFPYNLLSDSPEGQRKEMELSGRLPSDSDAMSQVSSLRAPISGFSSDIRKGFVYKRVPHITLKAIANNEEIDAIHAEWQPKLNAVFQKLTKLVKALSHDWELPREPEEKWPEAAKKLVVEWWQIKRARQAAMDASIARRADTEFLFDQPVEDNKRIRVTGPFTVESLSPHRTISYAKKKGLAEGKVAPGFIVKLVGAGEFGNIIIENLLKAGVQNTIKNERLKFDRLDIHPGLWIHAAGEYTEKDGKVRRVAVCIGPEHGTVGPQLIQDAAKEAVKGIGYDTLIVCGFAFGAHVSEETKRYGKLVVLPARIHADLQMGDEFLKKTGAGNLFTVFGEPDLAVRKTKDGQLVVEIRGLDVYDPTTGQIRNNTVDDIACWFLDTNYNEESFFVRHAYFTGADQPYEKLKKALRAEIDEAAWSALYATTSRPFPLPTTGKFAVKVINHYGDEVLKVYDVGRH